MVLFKDKVSIDTRAGVDADSAGSIIQSTDWSTTVSCVAWSPDSRYLAVGGVNATPVGQVRIYRFNGTALTALATQTWSASTRVLSVAWSPDGRFLAAGGVAGSSDVVVYRVNGATLTSVATN